MRPHVLLVLVLIGQNVFLWRRFGVALGAVDRTIPQAGRRANIVVEHLQVRPGYFQQNLLLPRNPPRHNGAQFVAPHARHAGQGQARIAGGRLDQVAARPCLALCFEPPQHAPRRPVFHRAERIKPFQLGVELELRRRIELADAHQRRRVLHRRQQFKDVIVDAVRLVHRFLSSNRRTHTCLSYN